MVKPVELLKKATKENPYSSGNVVRTFKKASEVPEPEVAPSKQGNARLNLILRNRRPLKSYEEEEKINACKKLENGSTEPFS